MTKARELATQWTGQIVSLVEMSMGYVTPALQDTITDFVEAMIEDEFGKDADSGYNK